MGESASVLISDGRVNESVAEQLLGLLGVVAGGHAVADQVGYDTQVALFAVDVAGSEERQMSEQLVDGDLRCLGQQWIDEGWRSFL